MKILLTVNMLDNSAHEPGQHPKTGRNKWSEKCLKQH